MVIYENRFGHSFVKDLEHELKREKKNYIANRCEYK